MCGGRAKSVSPLGSSRRWNHPDTAIQTEDGSVASSEGAVSCFASRYVPRRGQAQHRPIQSRFRQLPSSNHHVCERSYGTDPAFSRAANR